MFDMFTRPRIYMRGRQYPGVQTSRTLGDYAAHRIGVNAEPTVGSIELKKVNEYLVIATSALWNVMTPKEVFEFIKANATKGAGIASKLLA